MNADTVVSGSMHKYPWKWNLSDLSNMPKNGRTVFSCFSCGGGSSMGYKLAGYTVIGNCEIDPQMSAVYKKNNKPKYSYEMDIREFNQLEKYPEELLSLDILDGSPPCSVFSFAGKREDGWNVEKTFREGQAKQKLDDLFFHFIETAKRLWPKMIIAENVEGLVRGNAKGYVNEIIKGFSAAGYEMQMFLLDSSRMGVPQKRRRVFFIGRRKDLQLPKVKLSFNEDPITFGEVRSEDGIEIQDGKTKELLKKRKRGDKKIEHIHARETGRNVGFTQPIYNDDEPAPTLTAGGSILRFYDGKRVTNQDIINVQSFPQDYDFMDLQPQYICGMSVPPVMMANIADQVYEQCLKDQ